MRDFTCALYHFRTSVSSFRVLFSSYVLNCGRRLSWPAELVLEEAGCRLSQNDNHCAHLNNERDACSRCLYLSCDHWPFFWKQLCSVNVNSQPYFKSSGSSDGVALGSRVTSESQPKRITRLIFVNHSGKSTSLKSQACFVGGRISHFFTFAWLCITIYAGSHSECHIAAILLPYIMLSLHLSLIIFFL